jgi:hypothetical protein
VDNPARKRRLAKLVELLGSNLLSEPTSFLRPIKTIKSEKEIGCYKIPTKIGNTVKEIFFVTFNKKNLEKNPCEK